MLDQTLLNTPHDPQTVSQPITPDPTSIPTNTSEQPVAQKNNWKVIALLLFVLLLMLLGLIIFLFPRQATPSENPTGIISNEYPSSPDTSSGAEYQTYNDDIFTLKYPSTYTTQVESGRENSLFFKYSGPTQSATELTDGVVLHVETTLLTDQTLESLIEKHIQDTQEVGSSEIVSESTPASIGNYKGFSHQFKAFGTTSTRYYLQNNSASADVVIVTVRMNDPQNMGYQKDIDFILNSLQIKK